MSATRPSARPSAAATSLPENRPGTITAPTPRPCPPPTTRLITNYRLPITEFMGMMKNYLMELLHLCSDQQFGQDAVEWAIVNGHLQLTYDLQHDLRSEEHTSELQSLRHL